MSDGENLENPTDEGGEDGDVAEQHLELTPEREKDLVRTLESLQQSLVSKIRLSKFTLPTSLSKSIADLARTAETQQDMVAHAIKPSLDAQSAWQKQFAVINSDIFKSHALAQSSLNLIASQLTRNIDLSALTAAGQIAEKFAAEQATWLKNIGSAIAVIRTAAYPPNLRVIDGLQLEEVEQVVMVDGIPLYGLPRTSIAEALIRADGVSGRREILGRRWKRISADCRMAVEGCNSGAVAAYIPFTVAALDALEADHTEAAQALVGSLVDAILNSYFGTNRYRYTPAKNGKRTNDAYGEFNVRQFIAFAPMWQTYQKFFVPEGDKVPMTFSRNATAHTVSPRQFNRRNAVQGLMFACSLLYRLDEEARGLEAARET